jgi:Glycosyl hydrolase family 12
MTSLASLGLRNGSARFVWLAAAALLSACAQPSSTNGSGGSSGSGSGNSAGTGSGNSAGTGSGNSAGTGSGNSTGSGSGNSTGSGNSAGTGSGGTAGSGSGGVGGPDGGTADGGVICSNTDKTLLSIDATGFIPAACNNVGIQGAWYCFADAAGTTSNCAAPPYNPTSKGMCLSGMTGAAAAANGAAIGVELNHLGGATPKNAYNATTHNVVGFEITITGGTGASNTNGPALRVSFTTGAATTTTQPFVDVPGAGTYRIMLADAVASPSQGSTAPNLHLDPTSIFDVQVGVTHQASAVPFNYCITSIKPILGPSTPPSGCNTLTAYGTPVCGTQDILAEAGSLALQNNVTTGAQGTQCVQALVGGACAGFTVTFPSGNFGAAGNMVWSYPSLVYGWQNGAFYGGYKAAKVVSTVMGVPVTWNFTTPSGGTWDAAYDIWFSPTANPATAAGGLELMIWLNYGNAQPSGTNPNGLTTTIAGETWQVWTGSITVAGATWQYLAYRRPTGSNTSPTDLKPFFDDAANPATRNLLKTNWYLLGVQAGYEIFQGSGTAGTSRFSISVN